VVTTPAEAQVLSASHGVEDLSKEIAMKSLPSQWHCRSQTCAPVKAAWGTQADGSLLVTSLDAGTIVGSAGLCKVSHRCTSHLHPSFMINVRWHAVLHMQETNHTSHLCVCTTLRSRCHSDLDVTCACAKQVRSSHFSNKYSLPSTIASKYASTREH
jgi:hypothetical protein